MTEPHKPDLVDATADDILAVFRDLHRQQCGYDFEADPDIVLTHDSTIADWRQACDLVGWRSLGMAMSHYWKVDVPLEQWRAVLEPPRQRRLGDVCRLLAGRVKLPRVRPAKVLGNDCATAGAFLAVRSCLADAGVDVSDVAPSTPLGPYARHHLRVFLGPVSQLAPGSIPVVAVQRRPVFAWIVVVFLLSLALMGIGGATGVVALEGLPAWVALLSFVAAVVTAVVSGPPPVQFGTLRTFRDLAVTLAGGRPA